MKSLRELMINQSNQIIKETGAENNCGNNFCNCYASCTVIYTDSIQNVNVTFGGGTIEALVEVTGIFSDNGIAAMFDTDNSTFWHGTKLDKELRSAVKLNFTVSYINPRKLDHSYDS